MVRDPCFLLCNFFFSVESSNLIFDSVPKSPLSVKVLPKSPNSVIVSWQPPEEPRGIISHYTLRWKRSGRVDSDEEDGYLKVKASENHGILKNLPTDSIKVRFFDV